MCNAHIHPITSLRSVNALYTANGDHVSDTTCSFIIMCHYFPTPISFSFSFLMSPTPSLPPPSQLYSWNRCGRKLLSSSTDWNVIVWDVASGDIDLRLRFPSPVLHSQFHPRNTSVASGGVFSAKITATTNRVVLPDRMHTPAVDISCRVARGERGYSNAIGVTLCVIGHILCNRAYTLQ